MPANLTRNAIAALVEGGDLNLKPLVQVVDVKPIASSSTRRVVIGGGGNSANRYGAIISDGTATHEAVLATQLNDRIKSGSLRNGSVVQLIDYVCTDDRNRKIIMILNMETIIEDCETIGNPIMPHGMASVSMKPSSSGPSITGSVDPFANTCGSSPKSHSAQVKTYMSKQSNGNSTSFNPTIRPSYKPPPLYKSRGAVVRNEAPARIIPIAALNPYQGRWAIKARVTSKGDLRRYNNARGDGKVFSFDVLDSDGGEIRITCFNAVVDRFYNLIEVGKVYLISKGSLKPAQKNYNHLNNEWEILLETSSTIDLCMDEDGSIPQQQFNFLQISEIENVESNSIVDIIGVATAVGQSITILRKNGMETQRRVVNLRDGSGRSVDVTLWGEFCNREGRELQEMVDSGFFPVVAVKAGKVTDFSGKSIGTISSSHLFVNPDHPEAVSLRCWFDGGGKDAVSESVSRDITPGFVQNEVRKTVSQIKDEGLGRGQKPDWIVVRATITFVKTDYFCYTACPLIIGDRKCSKKAIKAGNGKWCCDRCDKEFEECDYRYLLQVQVQDHTGLTWVTAFQESGEEILGCSAKELYFLKNEEGDDVRFAEIIRSCLFEQYLFRLKIKEEMFGDEQRVKISVVKAERVNPFLESRYLLDLISRLI